MNILATGHRLNEGSEGYTLETTMHIERDPSATSADAALYEILSNPNVPVRGDPHPFVPGIKVLERDAEPVSDDPGRIIVKLRYGVPQPGDPVSGVTTVRTGSGATSEQVNVDLDGQPILTQLQVDTPLPDGSGTTTRVDEQVHNVDVERPTTSVEFERVETANPTPQSVRYVGRVNAVTWYGGAAGTWLCTGIQGNSDDGGATYKVTYSFQYNPNGWNPTVRHRNPQTGLPAFFSPFLPSVITPRVYPSIGFGALWLLQGVNT